MPKTLGISLSIHLYFFLENCQIDKKMSLNMTIFYCVLGCGIQSWHLASISVRDLTPVSLESISFSLGPL